VRRVTDAVFSGVTVIIAVYWLFGHPEKRLLAALSVGYLALLVAALLGYRLSGLAFRQIFRVRRLHEQSPPPVVASMDTARQLARAGARIQAIKMVRQLNGMSLEDAIAVVKEMERKPPGSGGRADYRGL
jgi:hypothetical protein